MIGDYAAAWLPVAMVPLVGIVGAAISMALLFIYIENEAWAACFLLARWIRLHDALDLAIVNIVR